MLLSINEWYITLVEKKVLKQVVSNIDNNRLCQQFSGTGTSSYTKKFRYAFIVKELNLFYKRQYVPFSKFKYSQLITQCHTFHYLLFLF